MIPIGALDSQVVSRIGNVSMKTRIGTTGAIFCDRIFWALIVVIVGIDTFWAWSVGIWFALDLNTALGFAVLFLINVIYGTVRVSPRIAALSGALVQLIAFTVVTGILSYLAVTSDFPLIDRYLSAADAALGFDWLALFKWISDHPLIRLVLDLAYLSAAAQIFVLLVLLSIFRMFERMVEFVWLYVLTLLIIIPISWLAPAAGAWSYYGVAHLTSAYYLPDFFALREGTVREIVMANMVGLIQFPSFHTTLCFILIYAARGIRILFPAFLGLNALMVASTFTAGGHYLADLIGGAAVVPIAIMIFDWGQRRPAKHGLPAAVC